jgi:hypothetical protein
LFQHDLIGRDALYATEPDNVLDPSQQRELAGAHRRAAIHRRLDALVHAQQHARCAQAIEQVVDRLGLGRRFGGRGEALHQAERERTGLHVRAVLQPRFTRLDPADALGRDAGLEQPQAGIDRRLAGADHDIALVRRRDLRQLVDRHARDAGSDLEAGRLRRWRLGIGIRRVDQHARLDALGAAGDQRYQAVVALEVAAVVRHREVAKPSGRQQRLFHHLVEVAADLRARSDLVEAGVRPGAEDSVIAERPRGDAVERGGLMEAYERIGVVPVPARPVMAVDHHDACAR